MYDPKTSKWAGRIAHYGDVPITAARRVLVYGPMGSGKSTLLGTFPKVVFLDADYGENERTRAGGHPVVYIYKGSAFQDTKGFLLAALQKKDVFDPDGGPLADRLSIGLDSWTKINELFLMDICREDGVDLEKDKPGFNQYGKLKFQQVIIMDLLKELNLKRNMNIAVTALPMLEGAEDEKLTQSATDKSFDRIVGCPNLVGAFRKTIGAEFEEVYYMERLSGAQKIFRTHTSPFNNFQAKTRLGLPATVDDLSYAKLLDLAGKASVAKAPV